MLTKEFFELVDPLASPRMGTETMAPLLYQLVRFTRPKRVLEVGMGYTTPFLAQALADNHADECAAKEQLAQKAGLLSSDVGAAESPFDRRAFAGLTKRERLSWLEAPPTLGDPGFYAGSAPPALVVIDDLSSSHAPGEKEKCVLEALCLSDYVEIHQGTFRGQALNIRSKFGDLDFIWFDCGGHEEYIDFFDEYWQILSGDGGLLLMHYTLTNLSMGAALKEFKLRLAARPAEAEIVSLLEPHKMMQNSFSIIRKTSTYKERIYYEVRDISLEKD